MQSLLFSFLKATEKAAQAVVPYVGMGDKESADQAATSAVRDILNTIEMDASIVIGEGEIDHAPMLFIGEKVGTGKGVQLDIAVDPIEGTTPTANGQNNGMVVLAIAPKDKLLHAPDMYMKKMVVGPKAKGKIDLDAPITQNLEAVAQANGKKVQELRVLVQDRPRHDDLVKQIRETGAQVELFVDGDVIYTLATCMENLHVDMLIGIGGAPEGVIGAVAVKSLGGDMQAQLKPRDEAEFTRCKSMGMADPNKVLKLDDMIGSKDCMFVATGITDSVILKGIDATSTPLTTHSMLIDGMEQKVHHVSTDHNAT